MVAEQHVGRAQVDPANRGRQVGREATQQRAHAAQHRFLRVGVELRFLAREEQEEEGGEPRVGLGAAAELLLEALVQLGEVALVARSRDERPGVGQLRNRKVDDPPSSFGLRIALCRLAPADCHRVE